MVPVWPSTLPSLLINGYSQGVANLVIKSSMDAGPNKVRRRFTAGVKPVQGSILVNTSQLSTFKSFYNDLLVGGSIRFQWYNPDDGETVEMRFVEPPSWSAESHEHFMVEMSLEIMP